MNTREVRNVFFFSFLLALGVVLLDTFYHSLAGLFIHAYYTTVKFVIVFLMVGIITMVWKKGRTQGVICAVGASLVFFIYYRIYFLITAGNAFLFSPKVGDSLSMTVIHVFILLIVYNLYLFLEKRLQKR